MKNKKGFTLVELLVTITILGIISMVAIPNIVGVVRRNKNKTYVEDAKKLVSLAEYKFRSDTSISISSGGCVMMTMRYLGDEEFENAPNGGEYDVDNSYVKIKVVNNTYTYYVTIKENGSGSSKTGVVLTESSKLYDEDEISNIIKTGSELDADSIGACSENFTG